MQTATASTIQGFPKHRLAAACDALGKAHARFVRAAAKAGQDAPIAPTVNVLRERIESGELQPGAKLPTEQDIVQLTGVARSTARRAVALLRAVALHYPVADGPDDDAGTAARHRRNRVRAQALGENWRPWRSVATWYLWRSLDPVAVEY